MIKRHQLLRWTATWSRALLGCSLGLLLCGAFVMGVAAEKKEAATKKDDAAAKSNKPPLGKITVLVPKKEFRPEGPNKALRVDFNDIDIELVLNTKKLTADIPKQMPEWLNKLNGQRVRLRGYMHPGSALQTEGIKRFVLCRDTSACCFGPNPTIYYLIETTMKSGTSASYIENKAFDVEGIFRIEPIVLEGTTEIDRFYFLDDAQIIKK